jgi:hypothetical protein
MFVLKIASFVIEERIAFGPSQTRTVTGRRTCQFSHIAALIWIMPTRRPTPSGSLVEMADTAAAMN